MLKNVTRIVIDQIKSILQHQNDGQDDFFKMLHLSLRIKKILFMHLFFFISH